MACARNRTIALLILVLTLSAGCSQPSGPTTPAAAPPTAASEEATPAATAAPTESEAPDPYAIPDDPADIDKAYVERVLDGLMVSIGKAARGVARHGRLTAAHRQELRATHREEPGSSIIRVFEETLEEDPSGKPFSPNATPAEITVKDVVFASRDCVFVLVLQDTSGLVRQEIAPFPAYYQLGAKRADEDPHGLNPTPWVIVADAEPRADGKEYANPCK